MHPKKTTYQVGLSSTKFDKKQGFSKILVLYVEILE